MTVQSVLDGIKVEIDAIARAPRGQYVDDVVKCTYDLAVIREFDRFETVYAVQSVLDGIKVQIDGHRADAARQ